MEQQTELKTLVEQFAGHHISYSETEAAERLGFSVATMRNLRNKRKISFSYVARRVRYTPAHLDEFLKRHEFKAK